MELFIWKVFVPMVKSVEPNDTESINQVMLDFISITLNGFVSSSNPYSGYLLVLD